MDLKRYVGFFPENADSENDSLTIYLIQPKKKASLRYMIKTYVNNLMYAIICAKLGKPEHTRLACRVFFKSVVQRLPFLKNTNMIALFLPWLKAYPDIFACDPRFRKLPPELTAIFEKFPQVKQDALFKIHQ